MCYKLQFALISADRDFRNVCFSIIGPDDIAFQEEKYFDAPEKLLTGALRSGSGSAVALASGAL